MRRWYTIPMTNPGFRAAWLPAVCLTACLGAQPAVAQTSPAVFTLADALARARDTSPEGAAADARVDATRRAVDQSGRRLNPLAELRFENWASRAPAHALPLDIFATLTQTFELGGKRAARRGIAEAGAGTAMAARSVVQFGLALDVSRTYLEAVRGRERQRLLTTRAAELAELVRVTASRAAAGAIAESDVLKMRTEQARGVADLVRARLAAARALNVLTARLAVDATLDALVLPAVAPPPARDDGAAVARRADIAAASQVVESARRMLRLEESRAMPDVGVNAGLKRTSGFNTGVVAITFNVPFFDTNRAARVVAQGQVLAAERDRDALARRALGEMGATRAAARDLAEEVGRAAAMLVEPARGALAAARAAFDTGAFDIMRLLDAERVYTDAALVALDLEIDAVLSAIEARVAAGEDPLP